MPHAHESDRSQPIRGHFTGGFDLAAQRAGIDIVASVEIDPAARSVLARHFPDTLLLNDVTKVSSDDLRAAGFVPERGVIFAGWPCQGNSVAGARGGMADPRSGLWMHVARLLAETGARWFVGENVAGLLSVNEGRDFAAVLGDLADLGLACAWRVLDAQHFGVPQRRRRVFLVGHSGTASTAPVEILFEPESGGGDLATRRTAGAVVAALTANGVGTCGADDNQAQAGHLIATALTAREGKGPDSDATTTLIPFDTTQITSALNRSAPKPGDHAPAITHTLTSGGTDASEDGTGRGTPLVAFHVTQDPISSHVSPAMGTGNADGCGTIGVAYSIAVRGRDQGQEWELGEPNVANALRAADGGSSRSNWTLITGAFLPQGIRENQRGEVDYSGHATFALTTGGGKPGQGYPAVQDQTTAVRRLTPKECSRLQGFPDDWLDGLGLADSAKYRMLGNAVAVPCVEWLVRRLAAVASGTERAA